MKKFSITVIIIIIFFNTLTSTYSFQLKEANHVEQYHNNSMPTIPNVVNQISATILDVLVVLMDLPNDPHHPSHTVKYYEDLFFAQNNPASVSQYFYNVSYGETMLNGDILGWYQAENNLEYYGEGARISPGVDKDPWSLINESRIHVSNAGLDPLSYDLFIVIHSGDGQEYSGNSNDLWSHKSGLSYYDNGYKYLEYTMNHEYVDYGTPSHELGHALYFPDLYDLNYQHDFAGPYAMMDGGNGHFSIWNKYYSKISRIDSAQFLTDDFRLQINNYSEDIYATVNPIAINEPYGIMWIELGWNRSGFSNAKHGRGWTVTVRENLDFDTYLTKYGVVIAEIQVGPRSSGQIQVSNDVSPPWNVIDSQPETSENKDDSAFSFTNGDVSTYQSGHGWAVQLLERYENLSYKIRVTNESNIPSISLVTPNQPISGLYNLLVEANSTYSSSISTVEISIDYGSWQTCSFDPNSNLYSFSWNTVKEREGTHIIRARAKDNAEIPYQGFSEFVIVEIDNTAGSILVVDDDLGRFSEQSVLAALDELELLGDYEIIQTTSFTEAEILSEEMSRYEYVFWIGNPAISPLANSHINYNEFKEIKKYLDNSTEDRHSCIVFMTSYNIFDFSNQGVEIHNEISEIYRARSPTNFRAPVNRLLGQDFLAELPPFVLGNTDSLRANRSSDGEVVTLLPGITSILEDDDPVFPGYGTKGYYVDTGSYKLVNYLFQPEMVPTAILTQLFNATLDFLQLPNNSTFSSSFSSSNHQNTPLNFDPFIFGSFAIISIGVAFYIYRKTRKAAP
ncbi:MAG: Ig-like domain-containing protein, partial [Candidatus Hodarchaeales archaeon]